MAPKKKAIGGRHWLVVTARAAEDTAAAAAGAEPRPDATNAKPPPQWHAAAAIHCANVAERIHALRHAVALRNAEASAYIPPSPKNTEVPRASTYVPSMPKKASEVQLKMVTKPGNFAFKPKDDQPLAKKPKPPATDLPIPSSSQSSPTAEQQADLPMHRQPSGPPPHHLLLAQSTFLAAKANQLPDSVLMSIQGGVPGVTTSMLGQPWIPPARVIPTKPPLLPVGEDPSLRQWVCEACGNIIDCNVMGFARTTCCNNINCQQLM